MADPAPTCPRAHGALAAVELKGVGVHACPTCHGTRLGRARLPAVLEAMSGELLKTFDPDTKLEAASAAPDLLACAACGQQMARDDYCGAGLALFDRCEACALLWVDAEALGTMTLMWARMEARHSRDEAETRRLLDEADDLVTRTLVGRAVQRTLFRLLGLLSRAALSRRSGPSPCADRRGPRAGTRGRRASSRSRR